MLLRRERPNGSHSQSWASFRFSHSNFDRRVCRLHPYRCASPILAKHGLTVVLVIYLALMLIHAATGCAALGWQGPLHFMGFLAHLRS